MCFKAGQTQKKKLKFFLKSAWHDLAKHGIIYKLSQRNEQLAKTHKLIENWTKTNTKMCKSWLATADQHNRI